MEEGDKGKKRATGKLVKGEMTYDPHTIILIY